MGIQLGALSAMAPSRRKDFSLVILRAVIAGNVACFMTACIAGTYSDWSWVVMAPGSSVSNSLLLDNYSTPVGVRTAEYCDQPPCLCVCLSICPRAYLCNRWTDRHEIFCADPLWPWLGPPLAALRYVMYFSGFMDNVMFGRSGPYGYSSVAIPGQSLMSMDALLLRHGRSAEYCDQPVCLCVCLFVCLSASISLEPLDRSARNFVCGFPAAVVRSSSGGAALCYVLPVLWMTSRLTVMGATPKGGGRRATTAMNDVAIAGRSLMSMNAG